jgi:hypothetical protein
VAVVRSRLWCDLAGRNDDLPGLHAVRLSRQRDHGPAFDVTGFEPQARVAFLGRRDEVVQGHPVGMRERKQQFQGGASSARFEPRERALGYAGRFRNAGQCHLAVPSNSFESVSDLVERRSDGGR